MRESACSFSVPRGPRRVSAETRRTPAGCGMQQARKLEGGGNRRGGAKPRGRKREDGLGAASDARLPQCRRQRGTHSNESHERMARHHEPAHTRALMQRQVQRVRTRDWRQPRALDRRGRPWRPGWRQRKVTRGAGKNPDHPLRDGSMDDQFGCVRDPEEQANFRSCRDCLQSRIPGDAQASAGTFHGPFGCHHEPPGSSDLGGSFVSGALSARGEPRSGPGPRDRGPAWP